MEAALAIATLKAISAQAAIIIQLGNLSKTKGQQWLKRKTSMCKMKMKRQKMCGGGNPPISINMDIISSYRNCQYQYLGDKRSSVKIESFRNFWELLQVLFPKEFANMHSHSEMFTKGFFNLISGFETSTI